MSVAQRRRASDRRSVGITGNCRDRHHWYQLLYTICQVGQSWVTPETLL